QVLDAREPQEVVGDVDEPLALVLQPLDALERPAFALRLRLLEVLSEELQVEAERAEVVLDLVDEPAGQLGQLGVRFLPHVPSGLPLNGRRQPGRGLVSCRLGRLAAAATAARPFAAPGALAAVAVAPPRGPLAAVV